MVRTCRWAVEVGYIRHPVQRSLIAAALFKVAKKNGNVIYLPKLYAKILFVMKFLTKNAGQPRIMCYHSLAQCSVVGWIVHLDSATLGFQVASLL